MYVDKIRFGLEPEALAGENDGAIRALFRGARGKAGMALRLLRAYPAVSRAYRSLANAESRAIFRDLLKYRLLGAYFTRIANNRELYEALEATMAEEVENEQPVEGPAHDLLGQPVRLWTVAYKGRQLKVLGSKSTVFLVRELTQYYYEEGGVSIRPDSGDVLLDGGAYLGEMSLRFGVDVGPEGQVYAFDPFPRHAQLARSIARLNGLEERVRFVAAGLGSTSTVASLEDALAADAASEDAVNAGRKVSAEDRIVTIDDFAAWSALERVDFIKMDIEGMEIAALDGARATIARWRPKLAICIYHRYDDLWVILNLLKDRYPFYEFYLGHYTLHTEETVLYARPKAPAAAQ